MPLRECCPVCESSAIEAFLRRPGVPVHQNLLLDDAVTARGLARGDLAMTVCRDCGFVFNAAFNANLLNYGAAYENTQTHSPVFAHYVDELIHHLVTERGLQHATIIEVGCGKGGFLKKLVEPLAYGNTGIGYDPSYLGAETLCDGRLRFRKEFYDHSSRDVTADAVVCRHVIEHIESPVELLGAVRGALEQSPNARVYFETPCVDWILSGHVVWDFFYEHCSLFTQHSLTTAFHRAGFDVAGCRHVFGGQYLWLEAIPAPHEASVQPAGTDTARLAREFAQVEERQRRDWSQLLSSTRQRGRVALWGAGAKGVTFANLIDPQGMEIDCVIDVNPAKQRKFLAGTGHPIVGPQDIVDRGVAAVLVLNPNYTDEIRQMLAGIANSVDVYDLMPRKRAA